MNRRTFLELAVSSGAGISAAKLLAPPSLLAAAIHSSAGQRYATSEWVAATPATYYRPYVSRPATTASVESWVQVDLGTSQRVDAVRLEPAGGHEMWPFPLGFGSFPKRFKLSLSDSPSFEDERIIADCTASDVSDPKAQITEYPGGGERARYVRLTVTRMPAKPGSSEFAFAVSRIIVLSDGRNSALQCFATADSAYGNPDDLAQLTRPPRPMGEGIVTDNPSNIIPQSAFKTIAYKAEAPLKGVTLGGGLFQTAMEQNIEYLLNTFTVDELLRQFRERAGKPNPPNLREPDSFWEEELAGSNAGRFLMGAGNTLRWIDNPELRRRLNAVVEGISECRQPNGYIMAYPEDTIFVSERGAYTRAWVTHGLIEAGYSGNPRAFELLRGYYNWFDECPYLPQLLRRAGLGPQGMIANTRMYFTPVGKPEDIQVIMRYFQENYWLEQLADRKDEALWQYPYDRPHCYEITFLEAYFDLYRATGEQRYLTAMMGAWQLYHDNWEHIGGSISMEEFVEDPPLSFRLDHRHGELCGSVFWTFFNQRMHLLYPGEEKYVTEIEKSIYNVALANQDGGEGIRYFAVLIGPKQPATHKNTCCEGQGTRLLGSLPEHIYSIAPDGFYVNLFEPSTLSWEGEGGSLHVRTETKFPFAPEVLIRFTATQPIRAKIRIRVPSWAAGDMPLVVNKEKFATGSPGTYITIDRIWSDTDTISFALPVKLKLKPYKGSQVLGEDRYSLEYGPILLAAIGAEDFSLKVSSASPEALIEQLKPSPDKPLHFTLSGDDQVEFMPYWNVDKQLFSCVPRIETTAASGEA
jgi:uncharacterized protein